MAQWEAYKSQHSQGLHTVVGTLKVLPRVYSPQLGNSRGILVWLPPAYENSDLRFPVVYMHDAQNLFDEYTSYAGEWKVDETLTALSSEGVAAIVVGIPHGGERRANELSPFDDPGFGEGRGAAYVSYLLDTVKPIVDADFRTLSDTPNTGIMGSSMGGLISTFGLFYGEQQHFGFAGIMSPYFGPGDGAIFDFVQNAPFRKARIYMDVGTRETENMEHVPPADKDTENRRYVENVEKMGDILVGKGYVLGQSLQYLEDEGAFHSESVWAKRLPDALRFLLSKV